MQTLQRATRKKVKLRMSIASPTGFGKTASALILAHGMVNDWDKIAVIDTENDSASLYANHKLQNDYVIGDFFTWPIKPPFTPEKYTEAIKACEDAGMEIIIIDSVTHVWQGQGGLLEYNSSLGNNTFQNWAKTTPRYQKWLDSILNSKCHIITTNRKKQAYALVENNGKKTVEKQGMDDQIRDGYDYEMTIAFDLINDANMARVMKDRSSLFAGKPEFVITEETGRIINNWCNEGIDYAAQLAAEKKAAQEKHDADVKAATKSLKACKTLEALQATYLALSPEMKVSMKDLTTELKTKLTPATEPQTTTV